MVGRAESRRRTPEAKNLDQSPRRGRDLGSAVGLALGQGTGDLGVETDVVIGNNFN